MSDHSPPARPGYTKTGKSLKAVRRYYALKEASKKKRTPERRELAREEEDKMRREERALNQSVSKRKRSPDDDFLSKRIANELRVQQEANERRVRSPSNYMLAQTERSALPIVVVSPKETGPIFVRPENPQSPKSAKSIKSVKSASLNVQLATDSLIGTNNTSPTSMGCVFTLVVIALVYVITYAIMLIETFKSSKPKPQSPDSTLKSMGWLAANSVGVLVASSFWLIERKQLKHAVSSLTLLLISTISQIVYLVFSTVMIGPSDLNYFRRSTNPLNFWLPVTFLAFHVITAGLIVKQHLYLMPKQMDVNSEERARMSEYMAPS